MVTHKDGNKEPGVSVQNWFNWGVYKEGSSTELMEVIEKIKENGAELDRKKVKVSWILK